MSAARRALGLTVCALLCACAGVDTLPSRTDTASDADFVETTCTPDQGTILSLETSLPEAQLALDLSWTLAEDAEAYVVYGVAPDRMAATPPVSSGSSGAVTLRGLYADEPLHLRLMIKVAGEIRCSEELRVELSGLDDMLPTLSAEGDGDPDEFMIMPVIQSEQSYLSLIDGLGAWRWVAPVDAIPFKTELALDREGILYNVQPSPQQPNGSVLRMNFDGSSEELWSEDGLHTDFVELPDGSLAGLVWVTESIVYGGRPYEVLGDALAERTPDGEVRVLWSAFDTFTPDLDRSWPMAPGTLDGIDWTHANGLSYDESNDSFVVSVPGLDAIVSIDRQTRDVEWVIGDNDGELEPSPADLIYHPHSVHAYGDNYLVFNRNDTSGGGCSDISELSVDLTNRRASLVREYPGTECLSVYFLGQARPTEDDGVMVVWSSSAKAERLDADWSSRWSVSSSLGSQFGLGDLSSELYPPAP